MPNQQRGSLQRRQRGRVHRGEGRQREQGDKDIGAHQQQDLARAFEAGDELAQPVAGEVEAKLDVGVCQANPM